MPTITVRPDGRVDGNTGVNRFGGRVDPAALADGVWRFQDLWCQEIAGTIPAMQLEQQVLAAVLHASTVVVVDGKLVFRAGEERDLIRFVRFGR